MAKKLMILLSHSGMIIIASGQAERRFVMPAEAGIQVRIASAKSEKDWIPAFAGMTQGVVRFQSKILETLSFDPGPDLFPSILHVTDDDCANC